MDNGNANPAQSVLDVDATMGHDLPKNLLIYAFGARLGGPGVPAGCAGPGRSSRAYPTGNLTLANYQSTYSHNDPAGAYPDNAFFYATRPLPGQGQRHALGVRRARVWST